MWKFLHTLTSLRTQPSRSQRAPTHLRLETLEGRTLLSAGPVEDTIFASHNRSVLTGQNWTFEMGISRIDPDTGAEEVLFSEEAEAGLYNNESIGQLAVADDGDVIFSVSHSAGWGGPEGTSFHRLDPQTRTVTNLFEVNTRFGDFALRDNAVVGISSRFQFFEGAFRNTFNVSRFDLDTGDEEPLYSKPVEGFYESAGHVAVADDGDILFSINRLDSTNFQTYSDVRRIDAQTGTTALLFSTEKPLQVLGAEADGSVLGTHLQFNYNPFLSLTSILSRFDPDTGDEEVLFSVENPNALYGGQSSIAVASDGDILFGLGGYDGTLRRFDSATGQVATLAMIPALRSVAIGASSTPPDPNEQPVALNDSYSVNEDATLTIPAGGVLANDADPDGDPLTAALVTGPLNGTLTLNANGSFTYRPRANYSGTDLFSYRASDGSLTSNITTVSLRVNPVNDAPVSTNDNFALNEDHTLTVGGRGVLTNDTDAERAALTAAVVARPRYGTLTLTPNGSFSYRPNANFSGTDSFTYRANDGSLVGNLATVTIRVNGVNDAPTATGDRFIVNEDAPLNAGGRGVLGNDADIDGNTLRAVLVAGPRNGTVLLRSDGTFRYTPAANFNGIDTFTYRASDGALTSGIVTVTIRVNPVNDAPRAVNDNHSVNRNTTLIVTGRGVLGNDTDAERDLLTAILAIGPLHGRLRLNSNGTFEYVPDANFTGTDTFTYRARDGSTIGDLATVTIVVRA